MKRRDVFLFASFLTMFVLFAIFQNFSFPTKQLQQITNKDFFEGRLQKFVPSYAFKNYIGSTQDIEAPYGYKEEISRRIASVGAEPIIFNEKKFIKEEIKSLPVYKNLKDVIDLADDSDVHCVNNPIEPENNCFTEYAGENSKSGSSMKVKANPFRQTASISVPGEIESQMMYDMDRNSVNVQFKKSLNEDAGLKLELDSQEQSGSINIDVRW